VNLESGLVPPPSKPGWLGRLRSFFQDFHARLFEVDQRVSTHARAPHQLIRNALAQFVAVPICADLLADEIQGRCHIGDRALVEVAQHLSFALYRMTQRVRGALLDGGHNFRELPV
jgi:hypothetical protein